MRAPTLRFRATVSLAAGGVLMGSEPSHAQSGRWLSDSGAVRYRLFVPSRYDGTKPVPLVVMLHGCTQDPDDFARGSRMNAIAEAESVLLLYPQQMEQSNPKKCWNWYDPAHQKRDAGEPAAIVGVVRDVIRRYKVDASRVYAYGISAGGAMAVILGATYPDVFAAIGTHSGLGYGAASSVTEGLAAMQKGGPDPKVTAAAVHRAMGTRARPMPIVIFHGDRDAVAHVTNAYQTADQWLAANALARGADPATAVAPVRTEERRPVGRHPAARSLYEDPSGGTLVELWIVQGLGHALSGGDPSGTFTDPKGPDSSSEVMRFLLDHRMADGGRR